MSLEWLHPIPMFQGWGEGVCLWPSLNRKARRGFQAGIFTACLAKLNAYMHYEKINSNLNKKIFHLGKDIHDFNDKKDSSLVSGSDHYIRLMEVQNYLYWKFKTFYKQKLMGFF